MGKPILFVMMGGGARGIECHTGILKALEELDIKADEYRGTSAGAIVSTLNAIGFDSKRMISIMEKNPFSSLIKMNWGVFWWANIFGTMYNRDQLDDLLRDFVGDKVVDNVTVTATREYDKKTIEMKGSADSIIASSSIPVVFPPYEIDGVKYVDGGVKDNIPTPNGSNRENYKHIYIFATNEDVAKERHYSSRIGRGLKWFDAVGEREFSQVEQDWNGFENVTIIRPEPFKSSLLDWSKNLGLVEHAYKETKRIVAEHNKAYPKK